MPRRRAASCPGSAQPHAAHVGLVELNLSAQTLPAALGHRSTELVEQPPGAAVVKPGEPGDARGRDAHLRVDEVPRHLEPRSQRDLRALEERHGRHGEPLAAPRAPPPLSSRTTDLSLAARTDHAVMEANRRQVLACPALRRAPLVELGSVLRVVAARARRSSGDVPASHPASARPQDVGLA